MRKLEPTQVAAGGELQGTPAHGSPLHTPPEQPKSHSVSFGVYEHAPLAQSPGRR